MIYNLYNVKDGPSALRFPRGRVRGIEFFEKKKALEFGKGVLIKKGKDVSILAVGSMVEVAIKASDLLLGNGVDTAVANARFVKPIDKNLIAECCEGGAPIFTIEENAVAGGFGDAVSEVLSEYGLKNFHRRIGIPDSFVPHGKRDELLADINLTPEGVAAVVKLYLKKS